MFDWQLDYAKIEAAFIKRGNTSFNFLSLEKKMNDEEMNARLIHFDWIVFNNDQTFENIRQPWTPETKTLFCRVVQAIHNAKLDCWFVNKAKQLHLGRRELGPKKGKILGFLRKNGNNQFTIQFNRNAIKNLDEAYYQIQLLEEELVKNIENIFKKNVDQINNWRPVKRDGYWPDQWRPLPQNNPSEIRQNHGRRLNNSLEYFSFHYLDMWLKHDKNCHEILNHGSPEQKLVAITKATKFYSVARTLPKDYDVDINKPRYEPILEIIDGINANDFVNNPLDAIKRVNGQISNAYGNNGVLSATTKLLWLKVRSPVIIYDAQVRRALNTEAGNFEAFYQAWQNDYENHREEIAAVCAQLSTVARYAYNQDIATEAYVREISAQPWFQERVFDVYLWDRGQ
jgi:hypothetical protein